jgi:hypothetical protein
VKLLDQYLAVSRALDDDERRIAQRVRAAVSAHVATVRLSVTPEGAQVLVDGEPTQEQPTTVDEGPHTVSASAPGYRSQSVRETATGGSEATWSLSLEREPAATAAEGARLSGGPERGAPATAGIATKPSRRGPIALGVSGLALAVVGGALVGASAVRFGALESRCAHACDPSSWQDWQTIERTGDVLLAVGGAAFLGGVGWWLAIPAPNAVAIGGRF